MCAGVCLSLSVQFSRSVVSDSLWPHESQHARPPCPSPTPRVHSDSRPSSQWCHPAISSYRPLLLPPIPPSIRVFPMSQLFAWGGQSTRVSALASFLPNNTQDWSPCSPRDSQESSPTILGKKSLEGPSLFMCLFTPSTVLCHKVDTQRMNGQHRKNITQNQYDYPTSSYKTCPYSGISFNSSDS